MDEQNWYAPLRCAADETAPAIISQPSLTAGKQKKRTKKIRIWAIAALAVLLLVGSSLAFGNAQKAPEETDPFFSQGNEDGGEAKDDGFGFDFGGKPSDGEDSGMPDSFKDFFSNYYTETVNDAADINIPVTAYSGKAQIAPGEPKTEELPLQQLYIRCVPSVVSITGYVNGQDGYYWGTGVVLSADGLILTNTHVVEGCDSAVVTLYDDTEYEAKLIGADSISDIAVLKIEAPGLVPAQLGSSSELLVGDRVAAIGNPLGEEFRFTLTDGIISAIDRGINYNGHTMTLIQTNTALNSGNSGGALFDMYGRVIGVTNMKMMSSYSSIEGIGFAIPSDIVINIVNALIADGEVRGRTSIGITVGAIPDSAMEKYGLPAGLYITAVSAGSDAEKKGLKEGDVLMEVNGVPVTTTEEVSAMKNALKVGDSMNFKIWREGEIFNVDVTLVDTNDIYS